MTTDSPFNFNKLRCSISKTTGVDHSLLERSKALFAQLTSATDTPSSASDSILSPETQSSDSSQPSSELLSLSETDPNPSPSSAPTEQSTSQTATNSNSSKGRPTKTFMEASPKTRIRKLMDLELPECCIHKRAKGDVVSFYIKIQSEELVQLQINVTDLISISAIGDNPLPAEHQLQFIPASKISSPTWITYPVDMHAKVFLRLKRYCIQKKSQFFEELSICSRMAFLKLSDMHLPLHVPNQNGLCPACFVRITQYFPLLLIY